MPNKVTDPALLAQLNGEPQPVTDPELLAQLNGGAPEVKGNPGQSGGVIPQQPADLEQILGPSDFTKSFASTPYRILKSAMQMVGAGEHVPTIVNELASEGDKSLPGRIAGDVAGTGGVRAGVGRLAQSLQALNAAKGILPAVGRTAEAATYGGVQGALTTPDDQMNAAKMGALGGAAGQVLGRIAGGIIKPTDEARVLLDRGVALTPGQAAGKGSLTSNLEQKATSIPIVGHLIEAARNRGLNEANVAAAKSVANIVDKNIKLGQPPREAIEQTRDAISKHYDAALANLSAPLMTVGNSLESAVPDIIKNNPMMTGAASKQLDRYVKGRFQQLVANGVEDFNGPQLKQLDSEIGGQIRNLQSSTNASDKVAAPAWRELQVRLRKVMADHAAGNDNQMLNQANAAYQQLLLLEKAMLPGADTFTPRQLRRALEGRKAADLGNTELSQVANAMDATLPNTVPDSGTTSRMLANALPLLTGGIGYGALGMPVAGMLLGTRTGAKAMTGSLPQQQALAEALRRFTPAALRGGKKDEQ